MKIFGKLFDKELRIDHRPVLAIFASKRRDLKSLATAGGLDIQIDFRGADLSGFDLRREDLSGFDLSNSDLRNTGVEHAIIDHATKLEGAVFDDDIEVFKFAGRVALSKIDSKTFPDLMRLGDEELETGRHAQAVHCYNRARRIAKAAVQKQTNSRSWLSRYADVNARLEKAWEKGNPNAAAWHASKHKRIRRYRQAIRTRSKRSETAPKSG
jgi:hypothetical protein